MFITNPKPRLSALPIKKQTGVVLPVALFMLVAATLLTLAFVKANMISLRVGGGSVIAAETQANAELKLNNFFRLNPTNLPDPDFADNKHFLADATYFEDFVACSDALNAPNAVDKASYRFDCRPYAAPPSPRRNGCQNSCPRGMLNDTGVPCQHHQVGSLASDNNFGSQAVSGGGAAVRLGQPKCY